MEISKSKKNCCTDSRIVSDAVNLGLKNVLEFAGDSVKEQSLEVRRMSANLLAQKVMTFNMPSFEFKSFEDVLEVKERHKDELMALDNYLFDISNKVELLPYELGYDDSLNRLIERRIQPAILDLKKSVAFSPNRIARNSYNPIKNIILSFGMASGFPEYIHTVVTTGVVVTILEAIVKDMDGCIQGQA